MTVAMPSKCIQVKIEKEIDIYTAVQRGKMLARQMGFAEADRVRIETVISELARNALLYAGRGIIEIKVISQGREGIEIKALDQGPGIADVELIMQDGYSTSGGLGSGLSGVRRLMDEFEIESTVGQGTTVRTVKWLKTGS